MCLCGGDREESFPEQWKNPELFVFVFRKRKSSAQLEWESAGGRGRSRKELAEHISLP